MRQTGTHDSLHRLADGARSRIPLGPTVAARLVDDGGGRLGRADRIRRLIVPYVCRLVVDGSVGEAIREDVFRETYGVNVRLVAIPGLPTPLVVADPEEA